MGDYISKNPGVCAGDVLRWSMKDNFVDKEGAQEEYKIAINLLPTTAYLYMVRGRLYHLKG